MVCAGRHDSGLVLQDHVLFRTFQHEFGFPLLDAEELVDIGMHLIADLFARLQAHHDELTVLAGE